MPDRGDDSGKPKRRRPHRRGDKGGGAAGPSEASAPSAEAPAVPVSARAKRARPATAAAVAPAAVATPEDASSALAWGSKKPKPAGADVLSYLLTSGGELARRKHEGSDRDEDSARLRATVLSEIAQGEASLSLDKRGSRAVEALARDCDADQLLALATRLKPYVGHLVYDVYGSHVVETIVRVAAGGDGGEEAPPEPDHSRTLELVRGLADQISKVGEWWALMHDAHGTHVARAIVRALAGDRDRLARVGGVVESGAAHDVADALRNPYAAPFLVELFRAACPDPCSGLLARVFAGFADFERLATHQFASRVLEAAVTRLDAAALAALTREWLAPHWLKWARHPHANFVVQRALEALAEKGVAADVAAAADALLPSTNVLLETRTGVLTSLVRAAARTRSGAVEKRAVAELVAAAGGTERAVERVLQGASGGAPVRAGRGGARQDEEAGARRDEEAGATTTGHASTSGALLLEACLAEVSAGALEPLLDALGALSADAVVRLCTASAASARALESVFTQRDEEFKVVRKRLMRTMAGRWVELATHRTGAHVVSHAFGGAPGPAQRLALAKELLAGVERVRGAGKFGVKLADHCKLELLKRDERAWAFGEERRHAKADELRRWVKVL